MFNEENNEISLEEQFIHSEHCVICQRKKSEWDKVTGTSITSAVKSDLLRLVPKAIISTNSIDALFCQDFLNVFNAVWPCLETSWKERTTVGNHGHDGREHRPNTSLNADIKEELTLEKVTFSRIPPICQTCANKVQAVEYFRQVSRSLLEELKNTMKDTEEKVSKVGKENVRMSAYLPSEGVLLDESNQNFNETTGNTSRRVDVLEALQINVSSSLSHKNCLNKKRINAADQTNNNVQLQTIFQRKHVIPKHGDPNTEAIKISLIVKKARGILSSVSNDPNFDCDKLVSELMKLPLGDNDARISSIVSLVYENALYGYENNYTAVYARIVKKFSKASAVTATSKKFRKQILDQCQKDFQKSSVDEMDIKEVERKLQITTDTDKRLKLQLELNEKKDKSRKRSLGNVKFVGELYKLNMLPPQIMIECITTLMYAPNEEKLECLFVLITVIGQKLDIQLKTLEDAVNRGEKPKFVPEPNWMDKIFVKINDLVEMETKELPSRIRNLLMKLVELRVNTWEVKKGLQTPDENIRASKDQPKSGNSNQSNQQHNLEQLNVNEQIFCTPLPTSYELHPNGDSCSSFTVSDSIASGQRHTNGDDNKSRSSSSSSQVINARKQPPPRCVDLEMVTADVQESTKNIVHEYCNTKKCHDTVYWINKRFPGNKRNEFLTAIPIQTAKIHKYGDAACVGQLVRGIMINKKIPIETMIKLLTVNIREQIPEVLLDYPMATASLAEFVANVFIAKQNNLSWLVKIGDELGGNEEGQDESAKWREMTVNAASRIIFESNLECDPRLLSQNIKHNAGYLNEIDWPQNKSQDFVEERVEQLVRSYDNDPLSTATLHQEGIDVGEEISMRTLTEVICSVTWDSENGCWNHDDRAKKLFSLLSFANDKLFEIVRKQVDHYKLRMMKIRD